MHILQVYLLFVINFLIRKRFFHPSTDTIYISEEDNNMTIGARIRTIRESQNITQKHLAKLVHVSSSFISRIENGSSLPSLELVSSLAHALKVPPQDILRDYFEYSEDSSVTERIRIVIEKFPPSRQLEILDTLEFLSGRLE